MESKIILTKGSSSEEIKNYFQAILKLSQADNEFPINLDEVWPLVYSRKEESVRELTANFIQDVDYQVFRKKAENLTQGGRPSNVYYLSLPCLEFFIARKVRPVFEVYRQVFHGVAQGKLAISGKPTRAEGYTLKEKVEFIGICHECGFYAWEIAGLVGDLLDGIEDLTELRTAMTELTRAGVLEKEVMQIVVSLYARHRGLPSTKAPSEQKEQLIIPTNIIPKKRYAKHSVMSMTQLLREGAYKVCASEVMQALYEHGYVRKVEYVDSTRWEWSLTTQGSMFGRNTSTRGGIAIRPKWLAEKFDSLMRKAGFDKNGRKEVTL